jgi:hypothetical protein
MDPQTNTFQPGSITLLPQGATVQVVGPSGLGANLTEVLCEGQRYATFLEDIASGGRQFAVAS